jgi:hypothetical protein
LWKVLNPIHRHKIARWKNIVLLFFTPHTSSPSKPLAKTSPPWLRGCPLFIIYHPQAPPHPNTRQAALIIPLSLSRRCHHCHCCYCCRYHHHYHRLRLLLPSLVGCCTFVRRPLLSSHAVMRPSTLSLLAAFATNHCPLPPPPLLLLPLPLGCHRLHCHYHGQTCRRSWPKKETTAAAPPAYQ